MPRLSREQIQTYLQDGYLAVPEFFTPEEIEDIEKYASSIASEAKRLPVPAETKGDVFIDMRGAILVLKRTSDSKIAIKRGVWVGAAEPPLLEYGRSEKLLSTASHLLGLRKKQTLEKNLAAETKEVDHLINQLHYKYPGDEVFFDWHRDEQNRRAFDPEFKDVNGNGSYVAVLIAIDEVTEKNGPVRVFPGSHKWKNLNLEKGLTEEGLYKKLAEQKIDPKGKAIPLLMKKGTAVFMDSKLVHGSGPNNSEERRCLFINGFSYPGANHKPYPGKGSAQRISASTSKVLPHRMHIYNKTNMQIHHMILKKSKENKGNIPNEQEQIQNKKQSIRDARTMSRREYQEAYLPSLNKGFFFSKKEDKEEDKKEDNKQQTTLSARSMKIQ